MWRKMMIVLAATTFVGVAAVSTTAEARMGSHGGFGGGGFRGGGGFHGSTMAFRGGGGFRGGTIAFRNGGMGFRGAVASPGFRHFGVHSRFAGGFHRPFLHHRFHHRFHRRAFFVAPFVAAPLYASSYYDSCLVRRWVPTHWGWRWRLVNLCGYGYY
jgi:hypothetical protein